PGRRPPRPPPQTRARAGSAAPRPESGGHRPTTRATCSCGSPDQGDAYGDRRALPRLRRDGEVALNEPNSLSHAGEPEPRLGGNGCRIEADALILDAQHKL